MFCWSPDVTIHHSHGCLRVLYLPGNFRSLLSSLITLREHPTSPGRNVEMKARQQGSWWHGATGTIISPGHPAKLQLGMGRGQTDQGLQRWMDLHIWEPRFPPLQVSCGEAPGLQSSRGHCQPGGRDWSIPKKKNWVALSYQSCTPKHQEPRFGARFGSHSSWAKVL